VASPASYRSTTNPMRIQFAQFFDHIYVINLIQRTDRRRDMEAQLDKIGVSKDKATFFPAIRPEVAAGFPSIGARGCFMSHIAVLEDALKRNYKRILICEDDLNFVRNFNDRIGQTLAELSTIPWAMFYGSYRLCGCGDSRQSGDARYVVPISSAYTIDTAHFLAFQGSSIAFASRYLRAMLDRPPGDARGGPMHVDGAYNWFRKENPQFVTVIATSELGYQRSSRSDIFRPAWYDQAPGISTVVGFARMVKSRIRRR
jgi:glycosyl transferase, family 25